MRGPMASAQISSAWRRPPRPCFTFFHALWLFAVIAAMFLAYTAAASRQWSLMGRALATLGGAIAGLAGGHVIVSCLVIFIVIPRLGRMTSWAYEVECYM